MSWLGGLGNLTLYCGRDHRRRYDFVVALGWCRRARAGKASRLRWLELYGNWLPKLHWRYVLPWAPPGEHVASDWTGRARELIGVRWPIGLRFHRLELP